VAPCRGCLGILDVQRQKILDLATAVILGVVVSALVFAWQHATHLGADVKHNEFGSKIYQMLVEVNVSDDPQYHVATDRLA